MPQSKSTSGIFKYMDDSVWPSLFRNGKVLTRLDQDGSDAGDSVLNTITGCLKENACADDTVSRHGGDEFLYLMMGSGDAVDLAAIATSIVNLIKDSRDIAVHGKTIRVRVGTGIGISIFPRDGSTATALVESADEAMYEAKREKSGYAFARSATS